VSSDSVRSAPLGVAVVGAGYWGPNLARNFASGPDWDLRWVCDLDQARAQKAAGSSGARTTPDLADVLADPDVHAVAIATPASTHSGIALQAIDAGKHVLVEKPLASNYADGEAIVVAAEQQGLVLMCDHTFCYTPAVQYLKSIVDDGTLGDVQFFDSVRINLGLVQHDIDVLWDLAPHDLSILDYVLPDGLRPVAVAAHGADPIGAGQDCVAYLTLQLPGGAIAHVHVNWLSPVKVRMTMIGGSRRTAVWNDMDPVMRVSVFDRGVDMVPQESMDLDTRARSRIAYRTGDIHAPALSGQEALAGMVAEFAASIREGRPPRTDGRAGLRVLDILEAASQSLAYKGAVVPLRTGRS
jgi:predicted dehydrogenase